MVVDVGAHCGLFLLRLSDELKRARLLSATPPATPTVIAFEPSPTSFSALRRNASAHALHPRVRVHEGPAELRPLQQPTAVLLNCAVGKAAAAAGDCAGANLVSFARLPGSSSVAHVGLEQLTRRPPPVATALLPYTVHHVRVTSLSAVCGALGVRAVHVLKVDVEGAELAVLLGMPAALWRTVRVVVVETHAPSTRAVIALLLARGLRVRVRVPTWAAEAGMDNRVVIATRCARR